MNKALYRVQFPLTHGNFPMVSIRLRNSVTVLQLVKRKVSHAQRLTLSPKILLLVQYSLSGVNC